MLTPVVRQDLGHWWADRPGTSIIESDGVVATAWEETCTMTLRTLVTSGTSGTGQADSVAR